MATKTNRGLCALFIRIALAVYFIITGLCILGVGNSVMSSQAGAAIYKIFSGDLAKIIGIIIAILFIIGGVCVAITIFRDLGNWDNTVMLILTVLWIVIAVIADVFTKKFGIGNLEDDAITWILNVAKDLLIIGGLLSIR